MFTMTVDFVKFMKLHRIFQSKGRKISEKVKNASTKMKANISLIQINLKDHVTLMNIPESKEIAEESRNLPQGNQEEEKGEFLEKSLILS